MALLSALFSNHLQSVTSMPHGKNTNHLHLYKDLNVLFTMLCAVYDLGVYVSYNYYLKNNVLGKIKNGQGTYTVKLLKMHDVIIICHKHMKHIVI